MNQSQTGKLTLKKPVKSVWSTKTQQKPTSLKKSAKWIRVKLLKTNTEKLENWHWKNPPNKSESNLKWENDTKQIGLKKKSVYLYILSELEKALVSKSVIRCNSDAPDTMSHTEDIESCTQSWCSPVAFSQRAKETFNNFLGVISASIKISEKWKNRVQQHHGLFWHKETYTKSRPLYVFNASKRISKTFFNTYLKTVYLFKQGMSHFWIIITHCIDESVVKIQWTPAKLLKKINFRILPLPSNLPFLLCSTSTFQNWFWAKRNHVRSFNKALIDICWGFSRAINSELWSGIVELYLLAITPY